MERGEEPEVLVLQWQRFEETAQALDVIGGGVTNDDCLHVEVDASRASRLGRDLHTLISLPSMAENAKTLEVVEEAGSWCRRQTALRFNCRCLGAGRARGCGCT